MLIFEKLVKRAGRTMTSFDCDGTSGRDIQDQPKDPL
jgi:hypothetical protein